MKKQDFLNAVGMVSILALIGGCATVPEEPLTPDVASTSAIYAMMSANAYDEADYKGDPNKITFPLTQTGWVADPHYNDKYGLAYTIFRKGGEVVFAIRGTDTFSAAERDKDFKYANFDLGSKSQQYSNAKEIVQKYLDANRGIKKLTFTGHSLGGGIALYLSAFYSGDVYAFDTSPRIFEAERLSRKSTISIMIYQSSEVNNELRTLSKDWTRLVNVVYVNSATKGFEKCQEKDEYGLNKVCAHSMSRLAMVLLKEGRAKNAELQKLCNSVDGCNSEQP